AFFREDEVEPHAREIAAMAVLPAPALETPVVAPVVQAPPQVRRPRRRVHTSIEPSELTPVPAVAPPPAELPVAVEEPVMLPPRKVVVRVPVAVAEKQCVSCPAPQ